jgi:nicotinamidase-related amidase
MEVRTTVLLVVDAQNGFLNGRTRGILPLVKKLCARWLDAGGAVVFSRYHNFPGSQFERLLHWYKLRDAPDTELSAELQPFVANAAAVIDKVGYTAVTAELTTLLAAHDWTHVAICGLDTETCVLKTAADIFELGLIPILISDACASNGDTSMHEAGLRLAGRFIGSDHVVTAEELESRLSRAADPASV